MPSHSLFPGAVSTAINTSNYQYDVFLSHRGCDTKNTFAGHLYSGLRSRGIRVFLDKEEMQKGEDLTYQIKAVIKNASIHLAIFSENYANSEWCLKELVLMVESGAIIIPVFFKNVEPTHLRWTRTQSRETEQNGSQSWETEQTGSQTQETEQTGSQTQETEQTGSQAGETKQIRSQTQETEQTRSQTQETEQTGSQPQETEQTGSQTQETEQTRSQTQETEQTRSQTQETEQTGSQTQETEQTGNGVDQLPKFVRGFCSLQKKRGEYWGWRYDDETIRKWKEALVRVSNISGFELKACNGYEAELLEKTVRRVLEVLKKSPFHVPKYEVGLDEKVEDFRRKVLPPQWQNVRVVGIVGLGGIGKTTLAKEFFHIESPAYLNSCFLPVSRNACITPLDSLFSELFMRLSRLDPSPNSIGVVRNLLEVSDPSVHMIKNSPSLVILDGVDNVETSQKLLEIREVLHPKSLILITSREPEVLRCSEVDAIYNLYGLNISCSRKLFCFHAFHEAAPLQGYEYLVECFLGVCKELPLLLKVCGALLCGNNDRSSWEDLLDRFRQIRPDEIENEIAEKLKVIYHKLGTEEQQTFLDIVCYFTGESTDTALNIWKGSGRTIICFQTLLEKRLAEVDSENCIKMHDLLTELGENISQETRLSRPLWR